MVNGMACTLVSVGRKSISVKIPANSEPVALFPSHDLSDGMFGFRPAYYPIRLGYSTTLHKIQGVVMTRGVAVVTRIIVNLRRKVTSI